MTKTQHVWMYKFKIYNRTHYTNLYATKQLAIDKVAAEIGSYEFDRVSVDNEDHSVVYYCRDGVEFELRRMEVRDKLETKQE